MIEAYKIGVSLAMETTIPSVISSLISSFEKLNGIIKEAQTSVDGLTAKLKGMASAIPALNAVAAAVDKINRASVGGARQAAAGASVASGGGSSGGLVRAPLLLGYGGGTAGAGPRALGGPGGQLLLGGPGGGGGLPPLFMGGGGGGGGAWNPLGGKEMVVEFEAYEVLKKTLEVTEKLNHEMVKLQTGMRLSDSETNDEVNNAFRLSRLILGSDPADLLKQKRELGGTMGTMEHAAMVAELVARGSVVTSSFVDKDTDLAKIAVRALEGRGQISKDGKVDPDAFKQEFTSLVRAVVSSEGLLTPEKLLQYIQQAGPAARNMNGDEFWGKAPAIMNALGASKAGTATMSLFSQMIGHVVAGARVAIAMETAGMLTPGKWHTGRGGHVTMDADAVPDQGGFADHPFTWLHEHLERMQNATNKDGKKLDMVQLVQQIFQLSSRATSARLISDIMNNWPIIENEERRYKKTPDIATMEKEQDEGDISKNITNLKKAWEAFLAAMGNPGTPALIGILRGVTDQLNLLQEGVLKVTGIPGLSTLGVILRDVATGFVMMYQPLYALKKAIDTFSNLHLPSWMGGSGPAAATPTPSPGPGRGAYNGPTRVYVENAHHIGDGIITALSDGASRPQSGPSGQDYRWDIPQPGLGNVG
jgi:hypothetical protein